MKKVLILEDEVSIRSFVVINLNRAGYEVIEAGTGMEALEKLKEHPDVGVAILDIMLPDIDGFEVCRNIRATDKKIGIIMLTARSQEMDKITGLMTGADDYVTKPFRPQILGAKGKALIRRSKSFSQENNQQISCGPFLCDTTTMRFYKNNVELNLSEKERSLLLLFVRHPQQVFTKDMIYEQIWGNLIAVDDNAIMVYINRLRSKIEDNARTPQHIITIRGVGYRFVP